MHGQFIVGSPLSFHGNSIEHTTKIKSNIVSIEKLLYTNMNTRPCQDLL